MIFFYFTEINPLVLCNDMAYDYMKNIMQVASNLMISCDT